MKKETIVAILFILGSIPFGIFLSMIPNSNTAYRMFQRIGYSLIFAGLFMLIREITFVIRMKMHSQTFSELFGKENDMIEFDNFKIIKENNKITIKIDLLHHYFNILGITLLCCVIMYIFLPSVNLKQEIEGLSELLSTTMIILEMIFIILAFICIFFLFLFIALILKYNIIKIIDVDRQTFTIVNKKRDLIIPFPNLKELEVWNNKNKENKKIKEIYYLIVPISNYSGDISIINSCKMNESIILLRDRKKEDILLELKNNMISFIEKFAV